MLNLALTPYAEMLTSSRAVLLSRQPFPLSRPKHVVRIESKRSIVALVQDTRNNLPGHIQLGSTRTITQALAMLPHAQTVQFTTVLRRASSISWHDPLLVSAVESVVRAPRSRQASLHHDMYNFARQLVWPRPLFAVDQHFLAGKRSASAPQRTCAWLDGFESPEDFILQKRSMPKRFPTYFLSRGQSRWKPDILDANCSIDAAWTRAMNEPREQCLICCDRPNHLLLPCAHALCLPCTNRILEQDQPCPFCKRSFTIAKSLRLVGE